MRGRHLPPEFQGEEAGLHTGKEGATSHCNAQVICFRFRLDPSLCFFPEATLFKTLFEKTL
jgi:hypothetical protein